MMASGSTVYTNDDDDQLCCCIILNDWENAIKSHTYITIHYYFLNSNLIIYRNRNSGVNIRPSDEEARSWGENMATLLKSSCKLIKRGC